MSADNTEDDEPGPAAALNQLKSAAQWTWMAGLAVTACAAILISVYLALSIPFFITGLPSLIKAIRIHFDASKRDTLAIAEQNKL